MGILPIGCMIKFDPIKNILAIRVIFELVYSFFNHLATRLRTTIINRFAILIDENSFTS